MTTGDAPVPPPSQGSSSNLAAMWFAVAPALVSPAPAAPLPGKKRRRPPNTSSNDVCESCRRSKVRCEKDKPCRRCMQAGRADSCVSWRASSTEPPAPKAQRPGTSYSATETKTHAELQRGASLSLFGLHSLLGAGTEPLSPSGVIYPCSPSAASNGDTEPNSPAEDEYLDSLSALPCESFVVPLAYDANSFVTEVLRDDPCY